MLKEGWVRPWSWFKPHYYSQDNRIAWCGNDETWRLSGQTVKDRAPKDACKKCLRIQKARKKKGR